MPDDEKTDVSKAMKSNYRSSGVGVGMDRSVYVEGAADTETTTSGSRKKVLRGLGIVILIVALVGVILFMSRVI
jgi:hypothetical protein